VDKIFEIVDKTGRKIKLTNKQWKHIRQDHPEIESEEIIKEALEKPTKITQPYEGEKHYYYRYYKNRKGRDKYFMAIVNYLNGDGFVITAFYVQQIK